MILGIVVIRVFTDIGKKVKILLYFSIVLYYNKLDRGEVKCMGTHSTVKFYDKNNGTSLFLYNQYDGYHEGVGKELFDFFAIPENRGNGFNDTVLLYVCWKKQGTAYNTYLTHEDDTEEFNYIIESDENNNLLFSVYELVYNEETDESKYEYVLQKATLEEFGKFISQNSEY